MIQFRHLFIYNHQKYVSYSKKKSFCSKYCHALVGQVNKSHWKVAPVIWKQCDTHILKQNQFKVLPINQQLNSLTFDTNTKSHIHQWQRHGFSDELSLVIKSNVTVLEKIEYLSWDFHVEPGVTLHDLTTSNQNKWQPSQDPTSSSAMILHCRGPCANCFYYELWFPFHLFTTLSHCTVDHRTVPLQIFLLRHRHMLSTCARWIDSMVMTSVNVNWPTSYDTLSVAPSSEW